jgi:hypothetical protein
MYEQTVKCYGFEKFYLRFMLFPPPLCPGGPHALLDLIYDTLGGYDAMEFWVRYIPFHCGYL